MKVLSMKAQKKWAMAGAVATLGFVAMPTSPSAAFMDQDIINQCSWYQQQARNAERKARQEPANSKARLRWSNTAKRCWYKHRQCLKGWDFPSDPPCN
jgi:hypothetical protein